jgi:adenylyltransferase/sulfurtransferase
MTADRLSADQMERYQAHLALPDLGVAGQQRLLRSRVLVVGLGGIGCPVSLYLAAAGVGGLTLLDDDRVDRTNLQRQVLFGDLDVGRHKADAAAERLRSANAGIDIVPVVERLTSANARRLVRDHDLVIDGSDNFATRYVVNDACVLEGVPLISGSLYRYEGQATFIDPPATPCYRCVFPASPPEAAPCHDAGVLGALGGVVGTVLAAEAVKNLAMGQTSLARRMLLIDTREMQFQKISVARDPACALCGDRPTILEPTAVTSCDIRV